MKRVFIRLFGCVLSAIGLGASYDTTMTLVMGKDKAPGSAWAAAGCFYNSGCIPSGLTYWSGITGITGLCSSVNGGQYAYHVLLQPFYVGWLNKDYSGTPITGQWPLNFGGSSVPRVKIDYTFSGLGGNYTVKGDFYRYYANTPNATTSLSLCSREDGIVYGTTTGLSDRGQNLSFRNDCVLNSEEVGGISYSSYSAGSKRYGAVYMYSSQPFVNLGCCAYGSAGGSGSSGTGSGSGDGTSATSSSCKCYYAPATQAYNYYYYRTASSSQSSGWFSTKTVPFYEPFVFYYFTGCNDGYYQSKTISVDDANYGINLMTQVSWARLSDGNNTITSLCNYDITASEQMTTIKVDGNAYYKNIWKACSTCPDMTSIYNSSSFSPTITSLGTADYEIGANKSTCYADMQNVKDNTGTFNLSNCELKSLFD